MSLAIPVAMVGSMFTFLGYVVRGLFNPWAVSYTHLDVYKRQVWQW